MSRILLAWEMGSNLGHVSRLLALGRRLRTRGHSILAVVRDLTLAARILGPAGIPFIQSPLVKGLEVAAQPASYADLLRYAGWADASQLWGATQAWVNVMRMFAPQIAILDYSPTALLATRCTATPCALMGTGFELPPLREPLPCFPGFPGATMQNAVQAEHLVRNNANQVLQAAGASPIRALYELFEVEKRWMTTFAELDHYGARQTERYVGPIGEVGQGEETEWPATGTHRVFAYLRPETPDLQTILRALAASGAGVVCYGAGISPQQAHAVVGARFKLTQRPVNLTTLLPDADLCVSYAPAGTVTTTLLRGIPQLLAPAHVEAQLTAHRVECMGTGVTLRDHPSEERTINVLQKLLNGSIHKTRAAAFASQHRGFDSGHAADSMVDEIESLIARQTRTSQVAVPHCSH